MILLCLFAYELVTYKIEYIIEKPRWEHLSTFKQWAAAKTDLKDV